MMCIHLGLEKLSISDQRKENCCNFGNISMIVTLMKQDDSKLQRVKRMPFHVTFNCYTNIVKTSQGVYIRMWWYAEATSKVAWHSKTPWARILGNLQLTSQALLPGFREILKNFMKHSCTLCYAVIPLKFLGDIREDVIHCSDGHPQRILLKRTFTNYK